MSLVAFCVPILPGKTEQWKRWNLELMGTRWNEYKASRDRYGIHERAFLQSTPQGDMAIITLEGDDPARSFEWATHTEDPFVRWFVEQVKETCGFDPSQGAPGPVPELVVDSDKQDAQKRAA